MFAIYTKISRRIPILVKGEQKQDTLDEDTDLHDSMLYCRETELSTKIKVRPKK
jgi:hypothetical protein